MLQLDTAATAAGGRGFLCLAEGSDCVLPVAIDASIAHGQIAVNSVQQHNLHLGVGTSQDFRWAPMLACHKSRWPAEFSLCRRSLADSGACSRDAHANKS